MRGRKPALHTIKRRNSREKALDEAKRKKVMVRL